MCSVLIKIMKVFNILYVTRRGASLSSLDELSRFCLAETQVYARLPAVSRWQIHQQLHSLCDTTSKNVFSATIDYC